jgi:chitodextrinase
MFMNTNARPPRVFLYKHLPSGPPPPPPPPDTSPPTVPTGLTATPVVSGVSLSWTASTDDQGVAGYRIYRNGSLVVTSQATSYLDSGLSPQTTYTYSVSAYDAAGNVSALSSSVSATTPAAPPPSAPVAAYSFSEGTGTTAGDASGYGNTGTVSNTTWTTSGKYGSALVFNGTSARVTIPHSASLALTTGMTLEAWVYPTNVSAAWRDVIMKGSDEYYLEASSSQGPPATGGKPNIGGSLIGSAALPANTWSHLAGTYDGTTLRLYVNGVQVASRAQTGSIATTTNPLQIGGDSFFGQYFQGTIDEVRIYNRVLTSTEIQNDMNTPVTRDTLSPKPPSGLSIQ